MEPQKTAGEKRSFGPLIGTILIIVVVVVGAFYFWYSRSSRITSEAKRNSGIATVSSSDDVDTLSAELEATSSSPDLSNLNNL